MIQVAALSHDVARRLDLPGVTFRAAQGVFPAVTCTAQASFRTASPPAAHGMVANGLYHRSLRKVMFWEQSSGLVAGPRIWDDYRRAGGTVAMLFWQQSMGEDVDILLTPAPIHKHHGGLVQDCYGKPDNLYANLCSKLGGSFKLHRYWGPAASAKVGDWIVAATAEVMANPALAPSLCLTYVPTLDYDFQRFGPAHAKSQAAVARLGQHLGVLMVAAQKNGYDVVIFGDYTITECPGGAVFINRALADAGLMKTRNVRGMRYPDFHASRAFAMVDHEVAHIYVAHEADILAVRNVVAGIAGVADVLDADAQARIGLCNAQSGELVAVTNEGYWFAYPWWRERAQAPDYASHIDIHNKPGFDPCELFFTLFPPGVSQDTGRIRGSHGRIGAGREIAIGSTIDMRAQPADIIELGHCIKELL